MKPQAHQLKYLSMKLLIRGPKAYINAATAKNLSDLPMQEASINSAKENLKTPDEIVKTL